MMSELIYKQDAIDLVKEVCDAIMSGCDSHYDPETEDEVYNDILEVDAILKCNKEIRIALANLPSAEPERRWIPIKWHDCTDEDREKYGFNNDIAVVFDCEMPDDNQSIVVTTSHGYINQDVCYIDDGYSLDSGWDWIDDIKAWMPLPEPYKGGE